MTVPTRVLLAADVAARDVGGAEHALATLDAVLPTGLSSYVASTHVVPGGRVAVAVSWAGAPSDEVDRVLAALPGVDLEGAGAREAAAQHADRSAGRLVRFAGRMRVERVLTVAEVLAGSVVDEVRELGVGVLPPEAVLDLTEWARPTWTDGRAVLLVHRAAAGLVPFESRHQIACCSAH
ncbi:hypothetical protein [Nocardioides litoris]|uniref:hypothetical protein n=1 Tax=Nocardioides litoris TaxID=1926648 RepID=UPI0011214E5D|nr:hypothetical protein [Nocardioides litoris]